VKHMFAGDPWYNGQGQQGGVQGMGFRPGPVQIAVVKPMPKPAPTFGNVMPTMQVQPVQPLLAQAANQMPQQQYQIPQQYQAAPQQQVQQPPAQQTPGRIPMGSKANCPVCRNFGG
jgi:hypothetical protein